MGREKQRRWAEASYMRKTDVRDKAVEDFENQASIFA